MLSTIFVSFCIKELTSAFGLGMVVTDLSDSGGVQIIEFSFWPFYKSLGVYANLFTGFKCLTRKLIVIGILEKNFQRSLIISLLLLLVLDSPRFLKRTLDLHGRTIIIAQRRGVLLICTRTHK